MFPHGLAGFSLPSMMNHLFSELSVGVRLNHIACQNESPDSPGILRDIFRFLILSRNMGWTLYLSENIALRTQGVFAYRQWRLHGTECFECFDRQGGQLRAKHERGKIRQEQTVRGKQFISHEPNHSHFQRWPRSTVWCV